jgi:threonine/homoserine/homoserine lactone efflux protein
VIEAITKGLSAGFFLVLSVGPTIFAILKYSISYGWRAGLSYIIGVSASDTMYVVLANLAASFLEGAKEYQQIIGIVGSLVLIAMGLVSLFKKIIPKRSTDTIIPLGKTGLAKIVMSGFLMNTFNPAVILFWMGMAAITGDVTASNRFIMFATTLIFALSGDILKVLMANRVRKFLTPRNIIYIQRIAAGCLLLIGSFILIKYLFNL